MGRFPQSEIFILSFNRPELLACTLVGVCGFNVAKAPSPVHASQPAFGSEAQARRGAAVPQMPVHIVDDGSRDPRVMMLLARYKEAGLIESVEHLPQSGGVGKIRRRMIDRFLDSGADQLVQVEADVLIGPGQIAALVACWRGIRASGFPVAFLNTYLHWWCRKVHEIRPVGPYRVAITKGGSEPFWTCDRESLRAARDAGLLPADRPDLVLWLDRMNGATLMQPEIQAQHLGAGKASIYYPEFAWDNVVFRQENERLRDSGPLRQPYPEHPLSWPKFQDELPGSALRCYEYLRGASPVPLPEFSS